MASAKVLINRYLKAICPDPYDEPIRADGDYLVVPADFSLRFVIARAVDIGNGVVLCACGFDGGLTSYFIAANCLEDLVGQLSGGARIRSIPKSNNIMRPREPSDSRRYADFGGYKARPVFFTLPIRHRSPHSE